MEHKALVIPVSLERHPNADSLSLVTTPDNYKVAVRTEDWLNKSIGIFIEPDTLVDVTIDCFKFLATEAKYDKDGQKGGCLARIKAKKLRNIWSQGLLVPATEGDVIGDNYWDKLNLYHYDPPIQAPTGKWGFITSGELASGPNLVLPKYDVDSFRKYSNMIFIKNEPIWITIKYHGSGARFVYHNNQFYCGSRIEWKKEFSDPPKANIDTLITKLGEEKGREVFNTIEAKAINHQPKQNLWWRVLRENELLQKFLIDNPNITVYGEVIGVQGIKFLYGLQPGEVGLRVFDLMDKNSQWLNAQEARDLAPNLPWVHILHKEFPYNYDKMIEMSENIPIVENIGSIEEGIVVRTPIERYNDYIGRSQVKLISPQYLDKS